MRLPFGNIHCSKRLHGQGPQSRPLVEPILNSRHQRNVPAFQLCYRRTEVINVIGGLVRLLWK